MAKMTMNKFKNQKVKFDGHIFDSKKECACYKNLMHRQLLGEISDLQCQVKFELVKGVRFKGETRAKSPIRYFADFTYKNADGELVVVDVKSEITRKDKTYRLKKHLMLALLNIEIEEV